MRRSKNSEFQPFSAVKTSTTRFKKKKKKDFCIIIYLPLMVLNLKPQVFQNCFKLPQLLCGRVSQISTHSSESSTNHTAKHLS